MKPTVGLVYAGGLTFCCIRLSSQWVVIRNQDRLWLDLPPDTPLEEVLRVVERELR